MEAGPAWAWGGRGAGVLRDPAMVLSGGGLPQSPGTECRMPVDGAGTQQFRNGLALQRQVEIVVAAGSLREARIEIELAVLDFLLDDLLGGVRVEFSLREQFFRQGMLRHGARRQDVAGYGAEVAPAIVVLGGNCEGQPHGVPPRPVWAKNARRGRPGAQAEKE